MEKIKFVQTNTENKSMLVNVRPISKEDLFKPEILNESTEIPVVEDYFLVLTDEMISKAESTLKEAENELIELMKTKSEEELNQYEKTAIESGNEIPEAWKRFRAGEIN